MEQLFLSCIFTGALSEVMPETPLGMKLIASAAVGTCNKADPERERERLRLLQTLQETYLLHAVVQNCWTSNQDHVCWARWGRNTHSSPTSHLEGGELHQESRTKFVALSLQNRSLIFMKKYDQSLSSFFFQDTLNKIIEQENLSGLHFSKY